jgi:hypothetical protein
MGTGTPLLATPNLDRTSPRLPLDGDDGRLGAHGRQPLAEPLGPTAGQVF